MNKTSTRQLFIFSILLIILAVSMRLINKEFGLYHLAPMAGIGLFAGATLKKKSFAYLIPIVAYFISDLFLEIFFGKGQGFYGNGISQFFVYAAMLAVVFLGTKMAKIKPIRVLGFSIAGSSLFWIISNFGVWLEGLLYPLNFGGLVQCYLMALPFYTEYGTVLFFNTFLGDFIFASALFGSYKLLYNIYSKKLVGSIQ